MKKYLTSFFLIISLLFFTNSLKIYMNIYNFDHTDVKNNIQYLSSDYFKGRLSGSTENYEVTSFIKTEFQKNGLTPFNGDYYDPFDVNYPHKLDENPFLKILDNKGTLIKEYKYGINYKEEMLNFKKNYVVFNNKDLIKGNDNVFQVTKGDDNFIFFSPSDNKLNFRSSFIGNEPKTESMYIMLSKDALLDIKTYLSKNYKVACFIPFEIRETSLNNVVGYIKSKDPAAPPIIISAHFDHVGSDLAGTVYAGALDNASGISFVLELSKYISSLGMPDRNIIFTAFNAEEFGLLGSNHFVSKYLDQIKGGKAYNFDMIGSNAVPLSIMGSKNDTAKSTFLRSIATTMDNKKIEYNFLFEDASDHEAFRKNNIDAITFCDSDMSRIHTPEDISGYISTEAIDRCFKVASFEIIKNGFGNNPFLMHHKFICVYSILGIVIFSTIYKLNSKL